MVLALGQVLARVAHRVACPVGGGADVGDGCEQGVLPEVVVLSTRVPKTPSKAGSRVIAEFGWRLDTLRAFDAFPMTHHVECVAALTRGEGRSASPAPALRALLGAQRRGGAGLGGPARRD